MAGSWYCNCFSRKVMAWDVARTIWPAQFNKCPMCKQPLKCEKCGVVEFRFPRIEDEKLFLEKMMEEEHKNEG